MTVVPFRPKPKDSYDETVLKRETDKIIDIILDHEFEADLQWTVMDRLMRVLCGGLATDGVIDNLREVVAETRLHDPITLEQANERIRARLNKPHMSEWDDEN
jgi:hypothetical protein